MNKQFIDIKLKHANLDRFVIRKAIFEAIENNLSGFAGNLLDVGCGKMPYKEYILKNTEVNKYVGLDLESALIYDENCSPDLFWDGNKIPLEENSFDCAFATEVLEHCPEPEAVLKEVIRVLKPGGRFFFTVPFLWNLHEVPNDEYRFTPFSLERHLKNSGFNNIKIKATGGWHASMAQMLGLWVRRSPIPEKKRNFLAFFIKPVIKYLIKIDNPEKIKFTEGQMITGLYGTASKK